MYSLKKVKFFQNLGLVILGLVLSTATFGQTTSTEVLETEIDTVTSLDISLEDSQLKVNGYIEGETVHFTIFNLGILPTTVDFVIHQESMMLTRGNLTIENGSYASETFEGITNDVCTLKVEDLLTGQVIEVILTR